MRCASIVRVPLAFIDAVAALRLVPSMSKRREWERLFPVDGAAGDSVFPADVDYARVERLMFELFGDVR